MAVTNAGSTPHNTPVNNQQDHNTPSSSQQSGMQATLSTSAYEKDLARNTVSSSYDCDYTRALNAGQKPNIKDYDADGNYTGKYSSAR